MNSTRATLLIKVKDRNNRQAWREFHDLYAPLLYRYSRARGLSQADAEEVRDQCLEVVTRKIGSFEYDKEKGGFKNWLRRIANHRVIDLIRKKREKPADSAQMKIVPDDQLAPDEVWDRNWRNQLLKYCLEQVREEVSEINYQAFRMLLLEECSVEEVCERLGLNPNQVYKAKSRVLQRVRAKLAELDSDAGI